MTDRERAEEILHKTVKKRLMGISKKATNYIIDAMLEFRNEGLREELITFQIWIIEWIAKNPDLNLLNCDVDEYLKTKE